MVTTRKPLSRRLRFEILKRDGFKCRYCGATPDQRVLHVDHVVPVVEGGDNSPMNLVTACQPCNGGKGPIPLGDQLAPSTPVPSLDDLQEQREQVKAYLKAQRQSDKLHEEVAQHFLELWEEKIGPMSKEMFGRLRAIIRQDKHEHIIEAIEVTGLKGPDAHHDGDYFDHYSAKQQAKYFSAVLRNLRENRDWRKY